MNEVKSPKKPMMYYYAIVILVILALNFLAVPWLSQRQVKEVDYGTFYDHDGKSGDWPCGGTEQPDPLHEQRRHAGL